MKYYNIEIWLLHTLQLHLWEYCVMYRIVKLLCCTPEIYIMLYVNYISIIKIKMKCRLSSLTSGLLDQNLYFNKTLKPFVGALKFEKHCSTSRSVWPDKNLLVFGKPNHSGKWRVRMSLLKYYYSNDNILFQSCYDSKVLARTSVIKAKASYWQFR